MGNVEDSGAWVSDIQKKTLLSIVGPIVGAHSSSATFFKVITSCHTGSLVSTLSPIMTGRSLRRHHEGGREMSWKLTPCRQIV